MPSSQNTTNTQLVEDMFAALNRKIQKSGETALQQKIESGEYVMLGGKAVPATILEEFHIAEDITQNSERAEVLHAELRRALHAEMFNYPNNKIPYSLTDAKKYESCSSHIHNLEELLLKNPMKIIQYEVLNHMICQGMISEPKRNNGASEILQKQIDEMQRRFNDNIVAAHIYSSATALKGASKVTSYRKKVK